MYCTLPHPGSTDRLHCIFLLSCKPTIIRGIYIWQWTVIEHNITQKSYTSSSGSSSRERGGEAMAAAAAFFLFNYCIF